jgi:hypothetical protein
VLAKAEPAALSALVRFDFGRETALDLIRLKAVLPGSR